MTPATRLAARLSSTFVSSAIKSPLNGLFSKRLLLSARRLPFQALRLLSLRLRHVAVHGGRLVTGAAQVSCNRVGDEDRAVAASRAAYADCDVGLALALIERQKVFDQVVEAADGLAHLLA